MESGEPHSRWYVALFGLGVSSFLLIGRWAPIESGEPWQPRIWIVATLTALAIGIWSPPLPSNRWLAKIAMVLAVWLAGSFLWSLDRNLASRKLVDIVLVTMVAWAVYTVVLRIPAAATSIIRWFMSLLMVLAAVGVLTIAQSGLVRLSVLGGGPNVYGRNMALLAVFGLAVWLLRPDRSLQLLAITVMGLGGALVFASGSRGALVALASGILILIVAMPRSEPRPLTHVIVGGVLAGSAVVAVITLAVVALPGTSTEATIANRIGDLTFEQRYDTYRGEFLSRAASCALEYPVAGAGLSGYSALDLGVYPHNITAEIACEQGATGVVLLMFVGTGFVVVIVRGWNREVALVTALVGTWLVAAQFSGDLYDARGVFVLGALAVAMVDGRATASTPGSTVVDTRSKDRPPWGAPSQR